MANRKIKRGREMGEGVGRAWFNGKIMGRGRGRGMRWMKGRRWRGRRGGGDSSSWSPDGILQTPGLGTGFDETWTNKSNSSVNGVTLARSTG